MHAHYSSLPMAMNISNVVAPGTLHFIFYTAFLIQSFEAFHLWAWQLHTWSTDC